MTVFFPLYCLSEMFSPVVDGSVKSGAVLPMIGNRLVAMHPPKAVPGSLRSPASRGGLGAPERTELLTVDRRHGERALEILLDDAPVQIVEERLDVLRAQAAVVQPVRVFVHVERQDRRRVPERERVLRIADHG